MLPSPAGGKSFLTLVLPVSQAAIESPIAATNTAIPNNLNVFFILNTSFVTPPSFKRVITKLITRL